MGAGSALELLEWCIEVGADECIGDAPVDRFKIAMPEKKKPAPGSPLPAGPSLVDTTGTHPVSDAALAAESAVASALTLDALKHALSVYRHCEVSKLARNLVFADGNPAARVMIVGEAPGAEEDQLGRPFVGRAGRLLDRMFAEIDLDRRETAPERSLYITNILPWRPPGNRNPKPDEIAMMTPFIRRHIELVAPAILILMGNISCSALLKKHGITLLRGKWHEWEGIPVMPMFHPAYLLRNPVAKGGAWIDLLMIRKMLADRGIR